MNKRTNMQLFYVVCILLILVYASVLLLPHSHEGGAEGCAACALIKSSIEIVAGIGLYFILLLKHSSTCCKFDPFHIALILHDSTPVWLKIKLSD